jgi:hypothetical protein
LDINKLPKLISNLDGIRRGDKSGMSHPRNCGRVELGIRQQSVKLNRLRDLKVLGTRVGSKALEERTIIPVRDVIVVGGPSIEEALGIVSD